MSIASQAKVSPRFGSMAGCQLIFTLQLRDGSLPEDYNGRRITKTINVRFGVTSLVVHFK
jgi:hypothetical protein